MPIIKVDGVGKIKVPDEWDEAQIGAFVAKEFGDGGEVADPETSWFFERFGEAAGKSYAAAEEGLAIGQLVVANDKKFALDLLEGEFNQWQNNAGEGEEPPAFLSMAGMGEIFGGVIRDIGVGVGVGVLAAPATTPIGGMIAGAAATTSLQALTAKGASFKDSYIQIRAKQLERGVDDKEAAYETARKISNADAAYAAAETVVSTAVPGFGKVGTRAITKVVGKVGGGVMSRAAVDVTGKAISELGVDAVAGGVGSIASDITAETIGGEQGVERGNIWENAAKAATAEALVGLPTTLYRTHGRRTEFKKREKYFDDALELGRQQQSDQQEIEAQTDIIVKRGQEYEREQARGEREQARRLKEGEGGKSKVEGDWRVFEPGLIGPIRPTKKTPTIQGKPVSVEGRLVLPPDVRNVPPPGMGIPVDESVMATGENVSPILDERGNVMLPSTHSLGGDPRGTEARAMQAQGARAKAAFSRVGHAKLGDAMKWLDNRIAQLESLRERGVKFPKKEFPIEDGQLELQFGWPTDGPALDALGFDENISRVLNPNFDLSAPAPGLNIDSELERLSDLRGRFDSRQSELEFKEKEAEAVGIKVTDHREPSHILPDISLDLSPPKPVKVFHSGFSKSSKEEIGRVTARGVGMGISIIPTPSSPNSRVGTKQVAVSLDHVANGGTLFIDNGAFGLYKKGKTVPFEGKNNAFEVIDSIVYESEKHGAGVAPENRKSVTLVMPDVIGDQQGTLELQSKHKEKIHEYIDAGFDVIIPMHQTESKTKRGDDRTLDSVYDGLVAEFGEGNFRVGVPSNKAAINLKDFTGLVKNKKPAKIHLLGRSKASADGLAKIKAAAKVSPNTEVSVDSSTAAQAAKLLEGTGEKPNPTGKARAERLRDVARTKRGGDAFRAGIAEEYIDIVNEEVPGFIKGLGLDSKHAKLLQDQMAKTEGSYTFGEFLEDVVRMDKGDIYDEPSGRARDYLIKAKALSQQPGASKKAAAWGKTMLELEADPDYLKSGALTDVEKQVKRDARAEGVEENLDQQEAKEKLNAAIAATRQIGKSGMTQTSMGVDPTKVYEALKAITSLARYHIARGVKSAAEFAKKAGLKLTDAIKKIFEMAKRKRAIQPKEMDSQVIAHLSGYDKTMTAEGQAKQATIDRIELILHPNMGSEAVRRLGDKFNGLDNLQKYYAEGREIPDTNNSYQDQQLSDGVLGKKNKDFNNEMKGIIEQMQEMNLPFDVVELYLYALHAKERNEHIAKINKKFPDGGSGMTEADRVEVLKIIRDSGKQEQYDKIVSQIYAINKRTLQIQLEGGLITQQDFDNLSNYYKNHVPLKGHHDNSEHPSVRTGNHIPISGEIKGRDNEYALGHGERSTDVLAHVFEQHATALNRAERNKVYQTLLRWVEANPDNEVIEVATTENAPLKPDRTPAKMEKVDGVDYIVEEATVKDIIKPAWQNDGNIVALRVNGENVYLRVKHDALAKNLKEMGTATLGEFPKLFAGFMRWRALSNTMLNVNFPLGNFIRDLETAGINLGAEENALALQTAMMKNVMPAFKAMWKLERGKPVDSKMEKMAELMRDNGGKMEYASLNNLEHNVRMIEEYDALVNPKKYTIKAAIKDKKTKGRKKVQNVVKATRLRVRSKARIVTEQKMVKGAFGILEDANAAMENATRLAVFTAVLETGKATPKQAAFMARNITVNFTKKGEWGTHLNTAYLFYNANFGGSLRIVQAAKSPRVQKILMGIVGLGAFENMFNQLVGEEDEDGYTDYDKINEYSKQSNILISADWLGELLGRVVGKQHEDQDGNILDGKYITIPTGYGYNVFHYAGKQITSVIPALGGRKSIVDAIGDTFTTAMNAFNPIGGGGDIIRSIIPEVGKPVLDLSRNIDWKGDRIAPDPNPFAKFEKPDSQMYWSTASTWGVNVAQTLNRITGGSPEHSGLIDISPETLDYAVQFIAGGMGKSISQIVDAPFKLAKGDLELEDIPIIRRFQEDPSPYFEMEKHKELRELVYRVEAGLKRLRIEKVGPRKIKEFKDANKVALKMLGRVKATDGILKNLNGAIKIVQASSKFNQATKNKKLEKLNNEKQERLRETQKKFLDKLNEK